jgi:anaerobic C4-dicarboxylate transporter DcuA
VEKTYKPGAKISVAIFGFAILLIIIAGAFPQLVPSYGAGESNFSITENGTLRMGTIIEIVTLSAAAAIMLITKTSAVEVTKASLFNSMASAVVSVFGVVWMAATFMDHNEATIKHALGDITTHHPWTFAIALFIMGMLTFSQAATTKTMMPLGVVLGIPAPQLIAMFPAVNSDFVLPGYPTLLAAINFDKTGSTHIGKFVVNHSFIRGGLITLAVSIALGFLFASLLL